MSDIPAVLVHTITFRPDDVVEITYGEARDQQEEMALVKTLMCAYHLAKESFDELQNDLNDILDDLLLKLRNPEEKF